MLWEIVIGLGVALGALWVSLVVFLAVVRPSRRALGEAIRLLPDTVRLLRSLTADPSTPPGIRIRVGLLLAYLAMPLDLIPDVIPGIGYADDAILVAATLRSVVRRAGPDALRRHWPGSAAGLAALCRLARLDDPAPTEHPIEGDAAGDGAGRP